MREIPEDKLCDNCGNRKATIRFTESGSVLDFNHGNYKLWCKRCVLERQLEFAQEQSLRIPDLQKELSEL